MISQSRWPAAPVDPVAVARALRPFGESVMLPPAAYLDPAVFAWEQQYFFGSGWTCAGFSVELAQPGDQRAEPAGAGSVLLTRDGELPSAEWHGLIFVDSSRGQAGPLDGALASLDELVAPYEPERLVIAGRHTYDTAANWKILGENFRECYHCAVIHPELSRVSPPKSADNYPPQPAWTGGWMELADDMDTMSLDGASLGVPLRGLDRGTLRTVKYLHIFPNVLLSPHPDYVMTHRLTPLAADRTLIECVWAFAPEALERSGFDPDYAVKFWDITNRQDWAACESVQRGLASPQAQPGPMSPEEDGVYQFVTQVARGYQGQPPARAR
jgi:Rieske 2Fe-2S family protein